MATPMTTDEEGDEEQQQQKLLDKEAEEARRFIESSVDIENDLIKGMEQLRVEHIANQKREQESRHKKPETPQEWQDLVTKRWPDAKHLMANDYSIRQLIEATKGKILSYEAFYQLMEDLEERALTHECIHFLVHPDLDYKFETRDVGDLEKDSYAVGCGETHAALFLPQSSKEKNKMRLYICRLNVTHYDAARKDIHDEKQQKILKEMGKERLMHWRPTRVIVSADCLKGERPVFLLRDTICIPQANDPNSWLITDMPNCNKNVSIVKFVSSTLKVKWCTAFRINADEHRLCLVASKEGAPDHITMFDIKLGMAHVDKIFLNSIVKPIVLDEADPDGIIWAATAGTVCALDICWYDSVTTWAIKEDCCYYQINISTAAQVAETDGMPIKKYDYWPTDEEELKESGKRGAAYTSQPRQPILSLYCSPIANSLIATSEANLMLLLNSKPKPCLSIVRDVGSITGVGLCGNVAVILRNHGEVIYTTIGGNYPGKPLQAYALQSHGAGKMPKNFTRKYRAVWSTVGRVSVLLPNGVLATFTPKNWDQIEESNRTGESVKAHIAATQAQKKLAESDAVNQPK